MVGAFHEVAALEEGLHIEVVPVAVDMPAVVVGHAVEGDTLEVVAVGTWGVEEAPSSGDGACWEGVASSEDVVLPGAGDRD